MSGSSDFTIGEGFSAFTTGDGDRTLGSTSSSSRFMSMETGGLRGFITSSFSCEKMAVACFKWLCCWYDVVLELDAVEEVML